jgi:hypothetical protein
MIALLRSRRFVATVEWFLLVILVALFIHSGFLPGWRVMNTDFPNYYLVATLREHRVPLDQVYDWAWLQREKNRLGIPEAVAGFAPYPPISVLPVLPLTSLPPLAAKRAWLLLNVGFLAAAIWLLHLVTLLPLRRVGLLALFCIFPLRVNMWLGQYYILLLLLFCAAYYAYVFDRRGTAGVLLAIAAALKIFPALALLLFVAKRDWRAVRGFLAGSVAMLIASLAIFGVAVHRVYFVEVLPRTFTGDLLSPYSLYWNSLSALWHRLFLFEPQLNPSPLTNSPLLYAVAQALTVSFVFLSFIWAATRDRSTTASASEWALFIVVAFLLSPVPAIYQLCVLIFTAVLGAKVFTDAGKPRALGCFLILFVIACLPLPGRVAAALPLLRLTATLALYILLLVSAFGGTRTTRWNRWLVAFAAAGACLFAVTWFSVDGRDRELARLIPDQPVSYRAADPIRTNTQTLFIANSGHLGGYGVTALRDNSIVHHSYSGADVLSLASASASANAQPFIYAELAGGRSSLQRLDNSSLVPDPTFEMQAERPSVSSDGRWLAWIQKNDNQSSLWLRDISSTEAPTEVLANAAQILDVAVAVDGGIIAAAGNRFSPRLVRLPRGMSALEPATEIAGTVRCPAISPDGDRLAFVRREFGSWHLFVRSLASGEERRLTGGSCNAFTPSWETARTLLYASDCGRGWTLTAIHRVSISQQ